MCLGVHCSLYASDDVFTTKEEIASEVKSMLEKAMTEFGYAIIQTLVTDIAPDQKVKIAMNEINAAQRQRVAAQDRAEAEKIMVVKAAEADAEAKYLAGTGMARQRQAIINGKGGGLRLSISISTYSFIHFFPHFFLAYMKMCSKAFMFEAHETLPFT